MLSKRWFNYNRKIKLYAKHIAYLKPITARIAWPQYAPTA